MAMLRAATALPMPASDAEETFLQGPPTRPPTLRQRRPVPVSAEPPPYARPESAGTAECESLSLKVAAAFCNAAA
jgi:hypothetical protein